MSEPTPRPWRSEGADVFGDHTITQEKGGLAIAAVVTNLREQEEVSANAHLIVRAVNSHDELLAAAKEARDELSQYTARWCEELAAKLDEAIEKAEDS